MIHINLKEVDKINYIIGSNKILVAPVEPYHETNLNFIDDLSKALRKRKDIREYPDVMALAFWCRKSNIHKKSKKFKNNNFKIGLGLVFHISPSNVPVNFAFSFLFGLLAGNSNIVRVPSKSFPQTKIICDEINKLLDDHKYKHIAESNSFIDYERSEDISGLISAQSDARVIWGGDETVSNLKNLKSKTRCIDIAFADRYSFSIISTDAVISAQSKELNLLIEGFFNDTYLMDQNACSSPHLIIWLGDNATKAKNIFWNSLHKFLLKKYQIESVIAIDKYSALCGNSIEIEEIKSFKNYGNLIYTIQLEKLIKDIDNYPGKFGYFFEHETKGFGDIADIVNSKYQTITYYGINKTEIIDLIFKESLQGIDRIVPIGQALDMDIIWDGYDVIGNLSRIIDVR